LTFYEEALRQIEVEADGIFSAAYQDLESRDKDGCTPNVRVPMVFSWCSLGILGDYIP